MKKLKELKWWWENIVDSCVNNIIKLGLWFIAYIIVPVLIITLPISIVICLIIDIIK